MQRQVSSLNNLDTLVILKGSQLNLVHKDREHLPASAGLPSSAGLYRSKSFGGDTLHGVASEGQLFNSLLSNRKKDSLLKINPVIGIAAIPRPIVQSNHNDSTKHSKKGKKRFYSMKSTVSSKILDSKNSFIANQRRARSLLHFAPPSDKKTTLEYNKAAANKSLESALEKLKFSENTTSDSQKTKRPTLSARKRSAADIAKLKASQDEKQSASSRTVFLECRAQFIKMNSLVQKMEALKWQKKSANQSITYEV